MTVSTVSKIKGLFLNDQWRFVLWVKAFAKLIRKLNVSQTSIEKRLLDALMNSREIEHMFIQINLYDLPFSYNLARLSVSELNSLTARICRDDGYRFLEIKEDHPCVIDVGAHIGVFSRFVLHRKPNAQVYALEPDRDNLDLLVKNLNPFKSASCFQKAILDKKGKLDFYRSEKIDWRSTLITEPQSSYANQFDQQEMKLMDKVDVTDLDSFVEEQGMTRCDYIKLTIGNFEIPALRGAKKTIETFRPMVALLTYPNNHEEISRFFSQLPFYEEVSSPYDSKVSAIRIFKEHESARK